MNAPAPETAHCQAWCYSAISAEVAKFEPLASGARFEKGLGRCACRSDLACTGMDADCPSAGPLPILSRRSITPCPGVTPLTNHVLLSLTLLEGGRMGPDRLLIKNDRTALKRGLLCQEPGHAVLSHTEGIVALGTSPRRGGRMPILRVRCGCSN